MSLLGATIFMSIATAVLAVGAIATSVLAYLAFRKQSQELELQWRQLQQQEADRRREQASRVFIWTTRDVDPRYSPEGQASGAHDTLTANVANTSMQPIYDLVVSWRRGTAPWEPNDTRPILMPGEQLEITRQYPRDLTLGERGSLSAFVRFRDSSGAHWLLLPDGQLTERYSPDRVSSA
jgi:hypothetical protein